MKQRPCCEGTREILYVKELRRAWIKEAAKNPDCVTMTEAPLAAERQVGAGKKGFASPEIQSRPVPRPQAELLGSVIWNFSGHFPAKISRMTRWPGP